MSINHTFCRMALSETMGFVKEIVEPGQEKQMSVCGPYGVGTNKQYHVEGPFGFSLYVSACCKWNARDKGWTDWITFKIRKATTIELFNLKDKLQDRLADPEVKGGKYETVLMLLGEVKGELKDRE